MPFATTSLAGRSRRSCLVVIGDEAQVDGAADVPRVEPVPVEQLPVVGDVLVGVHEQPAELGVLKRLELRPVGARVPLDGAGGTQQVRPASDHRADPADTLSTAAADG